MTTRYQLRQAAQLCLTCPKPTAPGKARCRACRVKQSNANRKRYREDPAYRERLKARANERHRKRRARAVPDGG